MKKSITALFILNLSILITPFVNAGVLEEIKKDFYPNKGQVISIDGDQVYTSFEKQNVVVPGDLVSVLKETDNIMKRKALLRVTAVHENIAICSPVDNKSYVAEGDHVLKYMNIKALFLDESGGRGELIYEKIKNKLTWLSWVGFFSPGKNQDSNNLYKNKEQVQIEFVYNNKYLHVRDENAQLIRRYDVENIFSHLIKNKNKNENNLYNNEIGNNLDFKTKKVDEFPDCIVFSKFLKNKEKSLLATTDGQSINIYKNNEKKKLLFNLRPKNVAKIIGLDWWSIDGQNYLIVNGWDSQGNSFSSAIYNLENEKVSLLSAFLPYVFGAVDKNSDGEPEILLAQTFERQNFVHKEVYEAFKSDKRKISFRKSNLEFPGNFFVQGLSLYDIDNDGVLESIYIRNGKIFISKGKNIIYSLDKNISSTLVSVIYESGQGNPREPMTQKEYIYCSPQFIDSDGDGSKEILVLLSSQEGQQYGGLFGGTEGASIGIISYKGGVYECHRSNQILNYNIVGYCGNEDNIFIVASQQKSIWEDTQGSVLLKTTF